MNETPAPETEEAEDESPTFFEELPTLFAAVAVARYRARRGEAAVDVDDLNALGG
mgnify:CR=1 FL=1